MTVANELGTEPRDGSRVRSEATRVTRIEISDEMRRAQADFHQLVHAASDQDLRRASDGTRWINRQLLYHVVFGYVIVRTLLPLVRAFGRVGHGGGFAATLNAGRRPSI
jgi:hypothetical protein